MPVFPAIPVQQYDSIFSMLNSARARLNETMNTLLPTSGKLLDMTDSSTLQTVNNGWRKQQDLLADRGYQRLIDEVVIYAFPAVFGLDPATQCTLDWNGCSDGNSVFETPQLPQIFTHPLKIWERWSGQNAEFSDPPMEKILGGLPMLQKTSGIRFWEWRNDAIYMPGSQVVEDLRIRFVRYLPDFADQDYGDKPMRWFQQPIPIVRASDSLSWFICAEVASAREAFDIAEKFLFRAGEALNHLFNLDVRADQSVNIQRRPRGGRGRNTGRWY